jgi:hypothetical protein
MTTTTTDDAIVIVVTIVGTVVHHRAEEGRTYHPAGVVRTRWHRHAIGAFVPSSRAMMATTDAATTMDDNDERMAVG